MKTCSRCNQPSDKSNYYVGETICKDCKRTANRTRQLKSLYGITEERYAEMYESQNGACEICKRTSNNNPRMKHFCVDHNHSTGRVRGLLCQECNFFLGKLERQLPIIDNFFTYIHKYS